jgi:lysophosphatidate acyltransferase
MINFLVEGTRRSEGKIHKFKHGAFNAAIHAQLPIIPIVYSSFNNFIDFENKTFRKGEISITILPEISTEGLKMENVTELMDKTRALMTEVYNKTSM